MNEAAVFVTAAAQKRVGHLGINTASKMHAAQTGRDLSHRNPFNFECANQPCRQAWTALRIMVSDSTSADWPDRSRIPVNESYPWVDALSVECKPVEGRLIRGALPFAPSIAQHAFNGHISDDHGSVSCFSHGVQLP